MIIVMTTMILSSHTSLSLSLYLSISISPLLAHLPIVIQINQKNIDSIHVDKRKNERKKYFEKLEGDPQATWNRVIYGWVTLGWLTVPADLITPFFVLLF